MPLRNGPKWIALALGPVLAAFAVAAFLVFQTSVGATFVLRTLVGRLEAEGLDVQVGGLGWSPPTNVTAEDLRIVDAAGEAVLEAGSVAIRPEVRTLLGEGPIVITDLELTNPRIAFMDRPEGWGLGFRAASDSTLTGSRELATSEQSGRAIQIESIEVTGARVDILAERSGRGATWADTTLSITGVDAQVSDFRIEPGSGPAAEFELAGGRVRLGSASPHYRLFVVGAGHLLGSEAVFDTLRVVGEASELRGSATASWEGDGPVRLDGALTTERLSPREIRGFAPRYPGKTAFAMDVGFSGDLDSLAVDLAARPRTFRASGSVDGKVVLRSLGANGLRWDLTLYEFDPGAVAGSDFPIGPTTAQLDGDVLGEGVLAWEGTLHAGIERSSVAMLEVGPSDVRMILEEGVGDVVGTLETTDAAGATTLDVEGRVAPFDSVVGLSLTGQFERSQTRADAAPLVARGTYEVDTRGTAIPDLTGNVRLSLDPASPLIVGTSSVTHADVALALHRGAGAWGVDAGLEQGEVDGRGVLTIADSETVVTAESLTWSNVDLAALLGDTIPSQLSGTGRARVVLGSPNGVSGTGAFRLASFEYGAAAADSATVDWRLEPEERLFASLSAWRSTGSLNASIEARRPLDPVRPQFLVEGTVSALPLETAFPSASTLAGQANARFSGNWEGRSPETASARADVTLLPSRIQDADSVSGAAAATLEAGVISVETQLDGQGGRIDLAARAEPFGETPAPPWAIERAEFERIDLALWVPGSAPRTYLTGRVEGGGVGLDASTFRGRIHAVLDTAQVGSSASGAGELVLEGGPQQTDIDVVGRVGSSVVQGNGWFSTTGDVPEYSFDLALRPPEDPAISPLEAAPVLQASPPSRRAPLFLLELRGSGVDPETMAATLHARADSVDWLGLGIDSLRIAANAADGTVALDSSAVWGRGFSLTAGGRFALHEGRDHDAMAELRLESFRSDGGLVPTSISVGTAESSAWIRGPFRTAETGATVRANALLLGGTLQLTGLDASGSATLEGLAPRAGELSAALSGLSTPEAAVENTNLAATYDGEVISVDFQSVVDARRTLAITARGDPRRDRREILLEQVSASLDGETWTLVAPAAIRFASGVVIDSLDLRAGDRRVFATGSISGEGTQDFRASVSAFEVGTLADLVGFDDLTGVISGDLGIQGTASNPEIDATWIVNLDDPQLRSIQWANDLDYAAGVLSVQDELLQDGRPAVTVSGTLPVRLALPWQADTTAPIVSAATGPVDLRLVADSASLAWLQNVAGPLGYGAVDGRLDGELTVLGTADNPDLGGTMRLSGGRVDMSGLGTAWTGVGGTLVLNDTMVIVEGGLARSGGGILRANGTAHLDDLSVGVLDVDLSASSFEAVDNALATATITGTTNLSGTFRRPTLSGTLRIPVADVYLTGLEAGAVRDVTLTPEDYEELRAVFGRDFRDEGTGFALVDSLTLDLSLDVGRDTWVRQSANPELAVQVDGVVRVEKTPGDSIRLLGEMDAIPERSYVEQFGRRFSLSRGNVTFRGLPRQTEFDVLGVYAVPSVRDPGRPEVTIELSVAGTVERMDLVLSSDPPMDNSDIVSYMATGRPASQDLGLGQAALSDLGTDLALDAVTSSIETAAAESVGLDVVEVEPDGLRGATLVAGRYVSPRLFVGFRQPVSWNDARNSEGGRGSGAEIEYQALRWLLLNLEPGGDGYALRLRSSVSY